MTGDLHLTNVRPLGGDAVDLRIQDGRIAAIGPGIAANGAASIDGGGALLLPGLVEAHTHIDKTFWGLAWQPHTAGPRIIDKIENERRLKAELGLDAATQSARQVVQAVGHGTSHIRTHIDCDPQVGVRSIEGVLATRERCRHLVDIEIVAFPQWGLLSRPGTAELMDEAMRLGADLVGGLDPSAIDRDPKGHLDLVFALAQRFGRGIDIHLHEPDALGAFAVELVCERTLALGMGGKVTLSHAFCLGMADRDRVDQLLDLLAGAGVAIMTTGPAGWPAPPLKRLVERGVAVCSGNDGIRDAWSPFGTGDMLERATHLALRNGFRKDEDLTLALEVCTSRGAAALGVRDYGLEVGCIADLVLVDAECVAEAVAAPSPRKLVVKRGRIVARDGRALEEAPERLSESPNPERERP
jgi:cytosine/adenosine deaminase-related metal-dependent hydrolase